MGGQCHGSLRSDRVMEEGKEARQQWQGSQAAVARKPTALPSLSSPAANIHLPCTFFIFQLLSTTIYLSRNPSLPSRLLALIFD